MNNTNILYKVPTTTKKKMYAISAAAAAKSLAI